MNHLTQMQLWGESSGIVVLDILNNEGAYQTPRQSSRGGSGYQGLGVQAEI